MDRNRKMLKMIEKNNSWRLILAMIRIAIYGITGIAVNLIYFNESRLGGSRNGRCAGIMDTGFHSCSNRH